MSSNSRWRPQFGLRTIFIVITVCALALALWSASGIITLLLLFTTLLLIPAFVAGIIYGRKDDRAFAIGGAAATFVALYLMRDGFPTGRIAGTLIWPMIWVWIGISGLVSMKVRGFLLKRDLPSRPSSEL